MKSNIVENSTSLLENVIVDIDLNFESLTTIELVLFMSSIALRDDIFLERYDDSERDVKFHLRILKHLAYLSRLKIRSKIRLRDNAHSDLTLSIFLISNNISIIFVKKIIETNLARRSVLNSIDRRENKILNHVRCDRL